MLPKLYNATLATYPRYVRLATIALVLTALVAFVLPPLLHLIDPSAGHFSLDTFNALTWGALLLAAIVHLGALAYGKLLPRFKTYQQESLEGEGKFFENLTDELEEGLATLRPQLAPGERLAHAIETRQVKQFKFLIRCVRTAFCLLSFYALVLLAERVLTAVLTAVPK